MDPNINRLQIAQTLIQSLLTLIPPASHAKAQLALDTAKQQLAALDAQTQAPVVPLVAPQLVPTTPGTV